MLVPSAGSKAFDLDSVVVNKVLTNYAVSRHVIVEDSSILPLFKTVSSCPSMRVSPSVHFSIIDRILIVRLSNPKDWSLIFVKNPIEDF